MQTDNKIFHFLMTVNMGKDVHEFHFNYLHGNEAI